MVKRAVAVVAGLSGWPILIVVVLATLFVPAAEERFFPIRINQSVSGIVRTSDRLCWTWTSKKVRPGVSPDVDAFVETSHRRLPATLFDPVSGDPWNPEMVRPVSAAMQSSRWCVLLPPTIKPSEPIRLVQTAAYPSVVPGMHVLLHMPDVVAN